MIKYGAQAIITVIISGIGVWITSFIGTVSSHEERIRINDLRIMKNDKRLELKEKQVKNILKNQCKMMRHFKVDGIEEECI